MPAAGLPGFPLASTEHLCAPPGLHGRGIELRPAVPADLAQLRAVYAQTRAEELALVPWPPEARQTFLDSQFDLQHRHYVTHFGQADFLVIEQDGKLVGRLYVLREAPVFRIIDIALSTDVRDRGIGSALMAQVQQCAAAAGCGVSLHVDRRNAAARRLYERLGFLATENDDAYLPMDWTASPVS